MALHRKHCSQSFFRVKVIGSDNWYRLARHSRRHLPLESLIIDQEYLLLHQKVLYIANSHRCFAVFPSRIRYYFPTTYSIWASPLTLFDNRMKPEGLRISSEPEPKDILMFLLCSFGIQSTCEYAWVFTIKRPYRVIQLSHLRLQTCKSTHPKH